MTTKKFRQALILSASLFSVALYGGVTSQQALAACTQVSGNPDWLECGTGENGISISGDDVRLFDAPGGIESIANSNGEDGINLDGDDYVGVFIDEDDGVLRGELNPNGNQTGHGAALYSSGDIYFLNTGSGLEVTGGEESDGIRAYSWDDTTIILGEDADVSGGVNGINAQSTKYGDVVVGTGAGSDVYGGVNGIFAYAEDGGVTITTGDFSSVEGGSGAGIYAVSKYAGHDTTIITGDASRVTGGTAGIYATAKYGSNTNITTGDGSFTAGDVYGIGVAHAKYAGDINITTGSGSMVSGGVAGISAINDASKYGSGTYGDINIVTGDRSNVMGGSYGIRAINNGSGEYGNPGGNLTIETGDSSTVTGGVHGIFATNIDSGDLSITTGDGSIVSGFSGDGIAVYNFDSGSVTITTGDNSQVLGDPGINVVNKYSGDVNITTGAGSLTYGAGAHGIALTNKYSGNATITTGDYSTVAGTLSGIAVNNKYSGDLTVTTGYGSLVAGGENGILASSKYGNTLIQTGDYSSVIGGINGIAAQQKYGGDLTVTTGADSLVAGGTTGINVVMAANLYGDLSVSTGDNSLVGGGDFGIFASTYTNVDSDTTITTGYNSIVDGADIAGIAVLSTANVGGNISVTTGDFSEVTGGYSGIDILAFENGEAIDDDLVNGSDITVTTGFDSYVAGGAFGIRVQSIANAQANVNITTGTYSEVLGGAVGIGVNNVGQKYDAGDEYTILAARAGDVNITTGFGSLVAGGDAGIAVNNYYAGDVTITTGDFSTVAGSEFGIAVLNELGGDTTITTGYDSNVIGAYGYGIASYNTLSGDNNITTGTFSNVFGEYVGIAAANDISGDINVTTGFGSVVASYGYGIAAAAYLSGDINITTGAYSDVVAGVDGIAVYASFSGETNITTGFGSLVAGGYGSGVSVVSLNSGEVNVTNNGYLLGGNSAVSVYTNGAAINITNNGFMSNLSENEADLAIDAYNGPVFIDNNGFLNGRVLTSDVNDLMVNDGLWVVEGFNNFYGGFDELVNTSYAWIQAANGYGTAEVTTFAGLEFTYNAGMISMSDQDHGDGSNISDRLVISGDYEGAGGALGVDAFLGAPGSVGDVMEVGGSTYGVTEIVVNDTNPGPGAYNPEGILVVDVAGNSDASHFELANGPIDKGMFFYDLIYDDSGATNQHLLVGLPDREVFETLAATSAATNLWYDSADAWSDRQNALRDQLIYGCSMVQAVADPPIAQDVCQGNLWVSVRGSWTQRDWDSGYSFANRDYEFDLGYSQDIYGIVGGADFGTDLSSGGQLLFGAMAGYMTSNVDFDEGGTSIDLEGGTFGVYATLLQSGFFLDLLGKADIMNADYDASSLGDYGDSDSASVNSYGVRADMGYHFGMGTAFIEPMLSFVAVNTDMDDLELGGADVTDGSNDSVRGGAGARLGWDGDMLTASLIGRAWYGFTEESTINIGSAGPEIDFSDDQLEGWFGEVAGQLDFRVTENATLFLNGGVEFNDDLTKSSVTGGLNWSW